MDNLKTGHFGHWIRTVRTLWIIRTLWTIQTLLTIWTDWTKVNKMDPKLDFKDKFGQKGQKMINRGK